MSDPVVLLAAAFVLSLTFYALLGGADYGGGIWDLLATGRTADRQRATIARAIGPVWEANHVWLIAAIVILFSGFPRAFATLSIFLHIPLLVVLVGIVFRGSAFVFRAYGSSDPRQKLFWGRVFAVSSTITPFFLGVIVGALIQNQPPHGGTFASVFVRPWLSGFTLAVGAFALTMCSYLAAVYLTLEAADAEEREAFRIRALASGLAVAVLAAVVLALIDPDLRADLLASSWALPVQLLAGASALLAFVLLARRNFWWARFAAAAQVTLILWGCALAQYPYAIRPELTIAESAAPENVVVLILQILGVGALFLLPALFYLFRIFGPRGTIAGKGRAPRSARSHNET